MIQYIISELKKNEGIIGYDTSGPLHYALISSGGYRNYQRGRINFIIFNDKGTHLFFAKFYKDKQMNTLIETEFEKQLFLSTTYKNLKIPKPLALLNVNGFSIMVEEAFNGRTLSRILSEDPSIESVIEVIDYGTKVQNELNKNLQLSSFSELEDEVHDLIHEFTFAYRPTPLEEFLIKKYTDIFLEQNKDIKVYKRFTNGDFVSKNIILSNDGLPVLIDFEFVEETHLFFLDWFRFFTHYFNVQPEIIRHIFEQDFGDYILNAALFKFRDKKDLVNNPLIGAMWLVFYIKDFIIKSYVFPSQQLKKEREYLRSKLSSAFTQDQDIMDLIRDAQINQLHEQTQQKDVQINQLHEQTQQKDAQINQLHEQTQQKDVQINQLHEQTQQKDVQINQLHEQTQQKDAQINQLHEQTQQKDVQINQLHEQTQQKDVQINQLQEEINKMLQLKSIRLHRKIEEVLRKVRLRRIIEKLMPQGTRRKRWYDLGIIGLRTIANEGWRSFWWKYREYRASKKFVKCRFESPKLDILSEDLERKVDLIEKKVSIVIPTKNAGSDFEFTLEKIINQKGIEEIEMIIVDSGSTDETVKLAEKYGAKVYSIKPEEFNHGLTRNYGAEKATGDYILFMVQDAIPIGDYWLYNMVKVLESDDKIVAASCRQVPRSDADLFACFSIWYHRRALNFYEDRTAEFAGDFDKLPPIEKRKLCGLDDVSTLFSKDVFDKFKFKEIRFAEDIDLGSRLIKEGYKLAFLHSVGVIHSHKRDAFYILSRYYIDNKILQGIFNYTEYYPECDFDEFLYSVLALYSALILSIESIKNTLPHASDGSRYVNAITKLESSIQANFKVAHIKFNGDQSLNEFFHKIDEIVKEKRTSDELMLFLLVHYRNQLNDLNKFIATYNPTEEDFIATLYKLFSIVVASALASKLPEYKDDRAHIIESLLEGGV